MVCCNPDFLRYHQILNSDMEKMPGFKHIYTVSELTSKLKVLLEDNFPFIWIYGEISNFKKPSSGHFYFTLKDERTQISAVMFRGQQAGLKFIPQDGMEITGLGRISLYEPRGTYQIILEYVEPRGVGALQKAFEQLKEKLAGEGLFDPSYKKAITFLPSKIALITSPTGAVIHDMLNIIFRRFENIHVQIFTVQVQGDHAAKQIVEALDLINRDQYVDVAVLARGGGSLEDFQPFNSEEVARAVFRSDIPVVSAIGHETDYTIVDFVADLRAPTPSAAAELLVPIKNELENRCKELSGSLALSMLKMMENYRYHLQQTRARLIHPKKRIQDQLLRLDDLSSRLNRLVRKMLQQYQERLNWRKEKLLANNTVNKIEKINVLLEQINHNLLLYYSIINNRNQSWLKELKSKLAAMNPRAILSRGYSITRMLPEKSIVRNAALVPVDQQLEIMLEKGALLCRVEGKSNHE